LTMPKAALLNSADSSQKTLLAKRNAINKGMFIAKIKNRLATNNLQVKPISRALFANNENKENENSNENPKNVAIVSRSKKIGKPAEVPIIQPSRAALGEITSTNINIIKTETDSGSKKPVLVMNKKTTPHFLEDQPKVQPVTTNYIRLNYMNKHTRKLFTFFCFQDKELKFPQSFADKTIQHSCDNDCTTDEDQIRGAKRNLQKALENPLKEIKEAEAKLNEKVVI